MKTKIMVVHGVSYFDESTIKRHTAHEYACAEEAVEAFNWDLMVPTPFRRGNNYSFASQPLAEIAHGFTAAAHLGFMAQRDSYAGFSRVDLKIHNLLAAILQLLQLFLLVALIFAYFPIIATGLFAVTYIAKSIAMLITGLIIFSIFKLDKRSVFATIRRIFLILIWPVYFLCLLIYMSSLNVAIGLIIFFAVEITSAIGFPLYWGLIAAASILCITAALEQVIFHSLTSFPALTLKITADFIRYIGLPRYRARLLDEFCSRINLLADENRDCEIIMISHSLGTVIVADLLIKFPKLLEGQSRITWVTMGSPINRLFARFFPEIYPTARVIEASIASTYENLRWVNVYRCWDYVGTRLELNEAQYGSRDAASNSYLSNPVAAHSAYWADRDVTKVVKDFRSQKRHPLLNKSDSPNKLETWPRDLIDFKSDSLCARVWHFRNSIAEYSAFGFWIVFLLLTTMHVMRSGGVHLNGLIQINSVSVLISAVFLHKKTIDILKILIGCDAPGNFPIPEIKDILPPQVELDELRRHRKKILSAAIVGLICIAASSYHFQWPFFSQWHRVALFKVPTTVSKLSSTKLRFSPDGQFLLAFNADELLVIRTLDGSTACRRPVVFGTYDFAASGSSNAGSIFLVQSKPDGPGKWFVEVIRTFPVGGCSTSELVWRETIDYPPSFTSLDSQGTRLAVGRAPSGGIVELFDLSKKIGKSRIELTRFWAAPWATISGGISIYCKRARADWSSSTDVSDQNIRALLTCPIGTLDTIRQFSISDNAKVFANVGTRDVIAGSVSDAHDRSTMTFPDIVSTGISADGALLAVISQREISVTTLATGKKRIHQLEFGSYVYPFASIATPRFSPDNDLIAIQLGGHIAIFRWRESEVLSWLPVRRRVER